MGEFHQIESYIYIESLRLSCGGRDSRTGHIFLEFARVCVGGHEMIRQQINIGGEFFKFTYLI
jgi:hypothetical protein